MRSTKKLPLNLTITSARVKVGKKNYIILSDTWNKYYVGYKPTSGMPKYLQKKTLKFTSHYQKRKKFASVEEAVAAIT